MSQILCREEISEERSGEEKGVGINNKSRGKRKGKKREREDEQR